MADTSYPQLTPLDLSMSSDLSETTRNSPLLSTGDLRRRYDFGERFSELAIDQTPFFRLVSAIGRKPTDDPSFKFTEKRQSWMKRYAYVVGYEVDGDSDVINDATLKHYGASSPAVIAVGNTLKLYMATDYKSKGNIQNVSGQSSAASKIDIGDADTAPEFFLPKQVVQINLSATAGGGQDVSDYCLMRVSDVGDAEQQGGLWCKKVTGEVVRAASGELTSYDGVSAGAPITSAYSKTIHSQLEAMRCYVVGSSYEEGSGLLGKTWKDSPYSTGYGQTQIWRTEFGMTNTARATALKYEPNEFARVWRDKLIEHKWEIEQAGLFSAQVSQSSVNYTQGAVDYVLQFGNIFDWSTSKTSDDFLDDMSKYQDPRYNQGKATVYFCDTEVYNWLHKLGGYFKQNIGIGTVQNAAGNENVGGSLFGADLAITGRKKVMGLDMTTISTVYGDINVTRCIALDRSNVKILGVNLNNVKYRPLAGNGVNRDTAIYVGVQSLENTGTDKRVDMILTEAGFEYQMPESHAIWK